MGGTKQFAGCYVAASQAKVVGNGGSESAEGVGGETESAAPSVFEASFVFDRRVGVLAAVASRIRRFPRQGPVRMLLVTAV